MNSIVLDGAEETVDLGAGYRQLNAADAILLRAAVVKSLVQISGVDSVRFTINGDSLLDSEDTPNRRDDGRYVHSGGGRGSDLWH